jgi:hypothetical protein
MSLQILVISDTGDVPRKLDSLPGAPFPYKTANFAIEGLHRYRGA